MRVCGLGRPCVTGCARVRGWIPLHARASADEASCGCVSANARARMRARARAGMKPTQKMDDYGDICGAAGDARRDEHVVGDEPKVERQVWHHMSSGALKEAVSLSATSLCVSCDRCHARSRSRHALASFGRTPRCSQRPCAGRRTRTRTREWAQARELARVLAQVRAWVLAQ
eukprot:2478406-Pleurochrysis_carterae.AAC.1